MAEDPLITHSRARVGRTLRGKWTLDRLIGVGGMAAVYEATHRNGSKVAIKMLHPNLMYETNFAARLVQEGYVANKINHPAAVKVHDDDTDESDGTVFLVMELLAGHPLSVVRRQRKRFPELEALKMMSPVLECLGNAHKVGIVHRDIKPENLFVQPDGQVRVLDFGIARVSDGSNVTATRTGMVVGSPAYMSPEQALGKMNQVGPQTDVYAVGATLFALISGTTPHAGESTQEMIVLVATQSARPLMSVMPDVNPRVAQIVDRALAYDKDQRYADAFVMLAEVRSAIAMLEGGGPPRTLPTFADSDDDEGATQVAPAMRAGNAPPNPPAQPPTPNAGMNRMGIAPPKAPGQDGPAPPMSRVRAPTMAPVGAPPPTQAMEAFPVAMAPQTSPSQPQMPPLQPPMPPMGQDPFAPIGGMSSTGQNPLAVPALNPLAPADVGAVSGQRPGVNTGMAWAGPPTATGEAPSPKPSSKKGIAIAGAVVAVLALVVGAKVALTDDPAPPAPSTPVRAAHAPPTPRVMPSIAPPVAPSVQPAVQIAAPTPSVAPAPSEAPEVPPIAVPTPSVAPVVAAPEEPRSHGSHGHHARDNTPAPSRAPAAHTGHTGHAAHGGHTAAPAGGGPDLGY